MARRLLNIASVLCLAVCVALMAMWTATAFVCADASGYFPPKKVFQIKSMRGRVWINWDTWRDPNDGVGGVSGWSFRFRPADFYSSPSTPSDAPLLTRLGLSLTHDPIWGWQLYLPFWFLVPVSAVIGILLRMRWPPQFTIRGIFIATTFLAVVLGMIAWLDRAWIGK